MSIKAAIKELYAAKLDKDILYRKLAKKHSVC